MQPRQDGRNARALRTREAIVDACISLVEGGELRPTAHQVAERGDVSVRSVFQHFEDLPALHRAVSERIVERVALLLAPVDTAAPLDQRIDELVWRRAALLEAITPYRRAANVHAPFAPELSATVRLGVDYLRDEVEQVFEPELCRRSGDGRRELADALGVALSWSSWDALRTEAGCSSEQAAAVYPRTVRALLDVA